MDEEEFRQIIEDYRLDCQFPQRMFRNEERCEKASWSNWALDELTAYVHAKQRCGKDTKGCDGFFTTDEKIYAALSKNAAYVFYRR